MQHFFKILVNGKCLHYYHLTVHIYFFLSGFSAPPNFFIPETALKYIVVLSSGFVAFILNNPGGFF